MAVEAAQRLAVLHEAVIALTGLVRLNERVAARKCLLQLLHEDPTIAHMTLPLATHLIQQNPDWQSHLQVTRLVQLCRPRAWVCRMLAAVPSEGINVQAEYLTGAALEIHTQLWSGTANPGL
jgi:hypothetical protein